MIRNVALLSFLAIYPISAEASEPFREVPAPVVTFAQQFQKDCQSNDWGDVVPGEFYRLNEDQTQDLNGDGVVDYIVYKCMFGCTAKPDAFVGVGTPCPWGSLLLSEEGTYKAIFLPGVVNRVGHGPHMRIKITKPRALQLEGNFCDMGHPSLDPQHVYELKDGRFQLVRRCPEGGCNDLLD